MLVWASSSTSTTAGLRARMASRSISSKMVPLYSSFFRGTVSSFCGQFNHALAAVGLDDADDDIFAAALAPDGLAQHAVGLSHAGRVSQKQFERAAFFFWRGFFKPLLWSLGHCRLLS